MSTVPALGPGQSDPPPPGFKEIEDAAFALKGQISEIIKVAGQYVILKCEGHLPTRSIKLEDARPQLEEAIRDTKLGIVANGLFEDLKKNAEVVNVLNDPVKSKQMPGVAALINGSKVSLEELAEMCIERHGEEVLGGTIQRRLLEQECKRRQVTVSEQELDAEIARAAAQMIEMKPDGSPTSRSGSADHPPARRLRRGLPPRCRPPRWP